MSAVRHPIKVVAQRTGLSPHLIRIWEKRYATIRPERSGGNQRLYSDEDIERLALLRRAVDAGHSIRTVAVLDTTQLRALVESVSRPALIFPAGAGAARTVNSPAKDSAAFIESAFVAVSQLDSAKLERALEEALVDFAGCAVIISHDRFFLDRIATHILAYEGDSHVEWFEGNFADYEEDKKRRLGVDSVIPHRLKYKKFAR